MVLLERTAPARFLPLLLACLLAISYSAQTQKAIPTPMEWGKPPEGGQVTRLAQTALHRYLPLALALEDRALESTGTLAKNLIVITADGLRWQEVFEGVPPTSPLYGHFSGNDGP